MMLLIFLKVYKKGLLGNNQSSILSIIIMNVLLLTEKILVHLKISHNIPWKKLFYLNRLTSLKSFMISFYLLSCQQNQHVYPSNNPWKQESQLTLKFSHPQ